MRFESILEWYSGKARDTIVNFVIPALVESEELGYWKKGVSRTVKAALNKQNVAQKFSRAMEEQIGAPDRWSPGRNRLGYDHPLHEGASDMQYGSYGRAPKHLTTEAKQKRDAQGDFTVTLKKAAPVSANATIERWAQAFAPVQELIELLDSRRPKPVFVMKTLSPTVAQNVSAHIGIDLTTIQVPDMHGEYVEVEVKGQKVQVYQVVIDWPEDTLHFRSKFLRSENHELCQACGHAIKDPYNWMPILAYGAEPLERQVSGVTPQPVPYSLWVGRDCASKLFGCKVEGDAIYKRDGKKK
ncbi:MAG TPA: hypothetical protein VLE97_11005 [Gaiellaceae bacterium]|nr:hypothetical protein [Gaiellaceae bacterium]